MGTQHQEVGKRNRPRHREYFRFSKLATFIPMTGENMKLEILFMVSAAKKKFAVDT
jgi:hypothetical protein